MLQSWYVIDKLDKSADGDIGGCAHTQEEESRVFHLPRQVSKVELDEPVRDEHTHVKICCNMPPLP